MTVFRPPARAATMLLAATAGALWMSAPAPKQPARLTAVAISPDGGLLAAGAHDGGITLWRTGSWDQIRRIDGPGRLNTLAFSPDSRVLAAAGDSLRFWRTADWTALPPIGKSGAVYGAARFSPTGALLATVSAAERIEFWSTATGALAGTLCCMALYGDLVFSPDGRTLAAAGHWPRLWDVTTGRELRRLVQTREPTFAAVAFSPDGHLIATGSQDGKARLWDAATGVEMAQSQTQRNYVETVAFDATGTLLAYGVRNGGVWLWDPARRSERAIAGAITTDVTFGRSWLAFGTSRAVHVFEMSQARPAAVLPVPE